MDRRPVSWLAASALRQVHQALADFPGELPPFRHKIANCRALLEDRSALPALPDADRAFLLTAYDRLMTGLDALQNFPRYQGALRALCMSDDPWATRPAVELLCSGFTSIKPEIVTVTPAEAGGARIGHMGFLRPDHRDTLWRGAADWLEAED